jgi:hypothetical protein
MTPREQQGLGHRIDSIPVKGFGRNVVKAKDKAAVAV